MKEEGQTEFWGMPISKEYLWKKSQKRRLKRSAPKLGRKPGKDGEMEVNRAQNFNLEVVVKSTEYFRESNG